MGINTTTTTNRSLFSFLRQIKIPKIGELREPISFYKSIRVPAKDEEGQESYKFDELVEPFANVWAKVWQFQGSYKDGQNTQSSLSHVFLIRNTDGLNIGVDSCLVWNGIVYSVRGTKSAEDLSRPNPDGYKYICVLCDEVGPFDEQERIVLDSTAPDDGSDNDIVDQDNPLWR